MIHRRREGTVMRWGINYNYNERTTFSVYIKIPIPYFVHKVFDDFEINEKYMCWQILIFILNFRIRNMKYWYKAYWEKIEQCGVPPKLPPKYIFDKKFYFEPIVRKKFIEAKWSYIN